MEVDEVAGGLARLPTPCLSHGQVRRTMLSLCTPMSNALALKHQTIQPTPPVEREGGV
jgi:hypothetical protein